MFVVFLFFLSGIWTRTVGTLQHIFAEYDDAVLTEMMPRTQIWCVDRNGWYHMSIKYSNITANIPRTTFMQHTGDMFQGMHGIVYIIYRFITPKRYVSISKSDSIKVTLVALPLTVTVAIWMIADELRYDRGLISDELRNNCIVLKELQASIGNLTFFFRTVRVALCNVL